MAVVLSDGTEVEFPVEQLIELFEIIRLNWALLKGQDGHQLVTSWWPNSSKTFICYPN